MKYFYFGYFFIFLSSCSSVNCNPGIVTYKINVNKINQLTDQESLNKRNITNLIDSIIPGLKCTFF
jgi:hypothetical protein